MGQGGSRTAHFFRHFWTKFMCTIMKHHTRTETSFLTSFWCKLIIRFACVEKLLKKHDFASLLIVGYHHFNFDLDLGLVKVSFFIHLLM